MNLNRLFSDGRAWKLVMVLITLSTVLSAHAQEETIQSGFPSVPLIEIAWHPNEELLALSSEDSVWIYTTEGQEVAQVPIDASLTPYILEWSPDGHYLAISASDAHDNLVYLWDKQISTLITFLEQVWPGTSEISWSPDSTLLATTWYNEVRIWDVSNSNMLEALIGHEQPDMVNYLSWNSNNKLAASSSDGTITIWEMSTYELLQRITPIGTVERIAWSPDNNRIVFSTEGDVQLWDVVSNQNVTTIEAHELGIAFVQWHGGTLLTSGAYYEDTTINLWDTGSWGLLETLVHAGNSAGDAMSLSPDGTRLIYQSETGIEIVDLAGN